MLWSLRKSNRRQIIRLMPRKTTLKPRPCTREREFHLIQDGPQHLVAYTYHKAPPVGAGFVADSAHQPRSLFDPQADFERNVLAEFFQAPSETGGPVPAYRLTG